MQNKLLKVENNDMLPILQKDLNVFVKPTDFKSIKIDNIVCLKRAKEYYFRRVIYKSDNYLITKGDNCLRSDRKIYKDNKFGVVTGINSPEGIIPIETIYSLQSRAYRSEIIKINSSFRKNGIDFIFLKGLPLHLHYEKTIPKRIYADCDLLIKGNDYKRAEKVLIGFGYKKELAETKIDRPEISYVKEINGIPVTFDVHREITFLLTDVGNVNLLYSHALVQRLSANFLEEKEFIEIGNQNYPVLSINNLIVYLLIHLFSHNFKGCYRYNFLRNVLNTTHSNKKILLKIKCFKLFGFVYPSVFLLYQYFKSDETRKLKDEFVVTKKQAKQFESLSKKIDIFQDEEMRGEGRHFRMIFNLSSSPIFVKYFIFFDKLIFCSTIQNLTRKITKKSYA